MSSAATSTTEAKAKQFLSKAVGTAQVGVTPAPAPELNGLLLQLPTAPQCYLVLNGFRCWIPDTTTFNNLFIPGAKITFDIGIGAVSEGTPLSVGACLVRGNGTDQTVYLVTNGVKMGIPSMAVFTDYQFNPATVQTVPQIVIDFLPTGPIVQGPQTS